MPKGRAGMQFYPLHQRKFINEGTYFSQSASQ